MSPTPKTCARCQAPFHCGFANGEARCWCADLPQIIEVNAKSDCLCPDCLKQEIERRLGKTPSPPA